MLPWLHPSRQKIALPCKMDGDCPFFSVACWARAKEVMQRTERVIARNSVPRVRYRHFVLQPQTFCVKSFFWETPMSAKKKALSTSAYQHMRCNKCAGEKNCTFQMVSLLYKYTFVQNATFLRKPSRIFALATCAHCKRGMF